MTTTKHVDADDSTGAALYWDIQNIQFHCRVSRTTAWRLVREQGFPAPVVLGPRNLIWPSEEVIAFLETRRRHEHYRPPPDLTPCQPPDRDGTPYISRPVRHRQSRAQEA